MTPTTPPSTPSTPTTWLITGANRGIGLALARLLLARGDTVIGTARDPQRADDLRRAGAHVEALDVADEASAVALAQRLAGRPIDVLINNAGVFPDRDADLAGVQVENLVSTFRTNAAGPFAVTRALLPMLRAGRRKLVANMSSTLGSIAKAAESNAAGYFAYNSSKAALNMLTVLLANRLRGEGIAVVTMHPGWVKTDMGGAGAPLQPDDSAAGLIRVLDGLTIADSGRYLVHDGSSLPW